MTEANRPDLLERAIAAMDAGDAERAYPIAMALCEAAPTDFQPHQLAGLAALDTSQPTRALQHFAQAVRNASSPALAAAAWCGIGQAHMLLENPENAEAAFRRALSLAPTFGPAMSGVAEAIVRMGRHFEAEQAGKRALELGVTDPRLHVALGYAYLGQERLDDAETEFRAAIALDPEAPEPQFGLGTIAKVLGRMDDANSIYRRVLTRVPDYPGYDQLAGLKKFTPEDEDIVWFESRFAELAPDASRAARADLHFALAKAYDDTGNIAQAVRHLKLGNELERERISFDPENDERRTQRIIGFLNRQFLENYMSYGLTGVRPVFIVSLPRSGSTLTEQMLASHSQIRGGGELGYLARVATELGALWGARPDFPEMDITESATQLRDAAREYARLTAALRLVQPYFTDKSLNNYLYIGLIRAMLPDARIIHVRRHPLATALGLHRQRFARGIGYSTDLGLIARHYRDYTRLMDHWRATVPEAFIELHYEALISDPEREIRRILDYLELEFEPACLEFYKLNRPVRTASVTQVRRPIDERGLVRHERYESLLRPVAESLREEIAAYEADLAQAVYKSDTLDTSE